MGKQRRSKKRARGSGVEVLEQLLGTRMLRKTLVFSFLFVLTSWPALAEYGGAQCEKGSVSTQWSFRCKYENLVELVYDQPTSSPDNRPAVSDFICDRGVNSVAGSKVEFWHYSPSKGFTHELEAAIYNPDIAYAVLGNALTSEDTGWASSGTIDLRNIVENKNIPSSNKIDLNAIRAVVKGGQGDPVERFLPVRIGAVDPKSPCRTLHLGLSFPSDLSNASFTLTGPIPAPNGTGQTRMELSLSKVPGGGTLRLDKSTLNLAGRGWYELTVAGFPGGDMSIRSFSYLLFVPDLG